MNLLKFVFISSIILVSSTTFISCKSKGKSRGYSEKTGISYNDPNNGGLQISKKTMPKAGPGLIAIEGGSFVMGGSLNEDLGFDHDNIKRKVTVASFYIDETEVSNADWLEYLQWISQNFIEDGKIYYDALPDSLVWRNPLSYNEPYVNFYFRHPSFQDYPVVGVSWEQANEYCQWRTDRVNEHILRESGMLVDYQTQKSQQNPLAFNTELYQNNQIKGDGIDGPNLPQSNRPGAQNGEKRTIKMEDGILMQAYRLPTEAEWEYAAMGLIGNTVEGNITSSKAYPWNGLGVRDGSTDNQGMMLANFKISSGNNMGIAGDLNDAGDITVSVKSYLPNDFGLYNMSGNVNEWVSDVYRQLSFEDVEDFNPYRGHVFMENQYVNTGTMQLAKDKYGRPIKIASKANRKQTWEELQASNTELAENKTYNNDVRGFKDEENNELYGKTTLVNNKSRVYKGGSWNDRAYWLNPATRRHLQQDEANAMIGFRCAMTMVGNHFATK